MGRMGRDRPDPAIDKGNFEISPQESTGNLELVAWSAGKI